MLGYLEKKNISQRISVLVMFAIYLEYALSTHKTLGSRIGLLT